MTRIERRWAHAVLAGFAPAGGPGLSPPDGGVKYVEVFEEMCTRTSRAAALGLRIALWMAVLAPIWWRHERRLLTSLDLRTRSHVLAELLVHPVRAVRELMLLLKMTASFALFANDDVREASGYDRPAPERTPLRIRRWSGIRRLS